MKEEIRINKAEFINSPCNILRWVIAVRQKFHDLIIMSTRLKLAFLGQETIQVVALSYKWKVPDFSFDCDRSIKTENFLL